MKIVDAIKKISDEPRFNLFNYLITIEASTLKDALRIEMETENFYILYSHGDSIEYDPVILIYQRRIRICDSLETLVEYLLNIYDEKDFKVAKYSNVDYTLVFEE